jgi:hypothetical protein
LNTYAGKAGAWLGVFDFESFKVLAGDGQGSAAPCLVTTTVYDLKINYALNAGSATQGLAGLARNAREASKATSGLGSALKVAGAAFAGFSLMNFAKSAFIDFNKSIESSTISIATQARLLKGGDFQSAMQSATGLLQDYQRAARDSVGETTDFLSMHQAIAASATRAGLAQAQLRELTIGSVVAANVLGKRSDVAAQDIRQMLAGTVGARDEMANILLSQKSIGLTPEQFNAQSATTRAQITMRSLSNDAFKTAGSALGKTLDGQMSTFKDTLSMTLGKVGLPLFKAITTEVQSWNTWLDANGPKVTQWGNDLGHALVQGFTMVKSTVSWIIDHSGTLMTLAKGFLAFKAVGMLGGGLGGGGIAGLLGGFGQTFKDLGITSMGAMDGIKQLGRYAAFQGVTALKSFTNSAAGAASLIAAAYVGIKLLTDEMLDRKDRENRNLTATASARDWSKNYFEGRNLSGIGDSRNRLGDLRSIATGVVPDFLKQGEIDERGLRAKLGDFSYKDTSLATPAERRIFAGAGMTLGEAHAFMTPGQGGYGKFPIARNDMSGDEMTMVRTTAVLMLANEQRKSDIIAQQIRAMTSFADSIRMLTSPLTALAKLGLEGGQNGAVKGITSKPINVHVKVEVTGRDPDRFAKDLGGLVIGALKNPRGSARAWRTR